MKITDLKTFLVEPPHGKTVLFIKVETDAGIHGWGEAYTLFAREPALERMILDFSGYLIGRDPFKIREFTHLMWRDVSIKRGGFDYYCAVSGIELALWDIVGKATEQPVYNLLGGAMRDQLKVYGQPSGRSERTLEGLAQAAANTAERGYKALKFDPFPGPWEMLVDREVEDVAVERVAAVREAVGPKVEIHIEVHRRLAPMHAIRVAHAIEQYKPYWFEEPTPAEDLAATVHVRNHINLPVVVGEALYAKWDFRRALEMGACDIINPDICNVGGLLELKEIAAMAECHCVALSPHGNNSTTVGLAASLQIAACCPNFTIMEYPMSWEPTANEIAVNPFHVVDGHIALPTAPGLGIELDEAALAKYPYKGKPRRGFSPEA
jgi:galactonate dehydratase